MFRLGRERQAEHRHFTPPDMITAPRLPKPEAGRKPETSYALLLNPFYPKDPRASYGKHVLTPSLALTSIAGSTPPSWRTRYWDENLLQGPPPDDPVPQVVAITVHLTFARRAYELAAWYRSQGSLVVLGGLHVLSCPDEASQHADAIAIGDGVQLWPLILGDIERGALKRRYEADFSRPYSLDPPPRRSILPRESFLTTTSIIATRGCHNRCGFCYLSTEGLHMPYRMRKVEQVVEEIRRGWAALRRIRRQQSRLAPGLPPCPVHRTAAPEHHLERRGDHRCHR